MRLFKRVSLLDRGGWNPHLIDEHDGEDGLIDEPGGAVSGEDKADNGRSERTFVSHVFKKGNGAIPEVGQSLVEFNLREALDSLQDDIELSSLAGTDGNTSGLNEKNRTGDLLICTYSTQCFGFVHLMFSLCYISSSSF